MRFLAEWVVHWVVHFIIWSIAEIIFYFMDVEVLPLMLLSSLYVSAIAVITPVSSIVVVFSILLKYKYLN